MKKIFLNLMMISALALLCISVSAEEINEKVPLFTPDGRVIEVDRRTAAQYTSTGWNEKNVKLQSAPERVGERFADGYLYLLCQENVDRVGAEYSGKTRRLYIGRGVENIPAEAFAGFENLSRVEISDTVTQIGSYAFADCTIERIGIPSSVEVIADDAFGNKVGENTVIYCEKDSRAEEFAKNHGIKYVVSGILYSPDDRTIMVDYSEKALYLKNGWFRTADNGYTAMYSSDGRCTYVKKENVQQYESVGWYSYKDHYIYGKSALLSYNNGKYDSRHWVSGEYLAISYLEELALQPQAAQWRDEINEEIKRIENSWSLKAECPLAIGFASVEYGKFGMPVATIGVFNLSGKSISSYEMSFVCRDEDGKEVSDSHFYSAENVLKEENCNLKSRAVRLVTTLLKNNSKTSYVDTVVINRVVFEDGSTWERK